MTDTAAPVHIQAIKLRRLSAGELQGAEASDVEAHAAACPTCRARLKEIADEQRRFEQEISFDRFAAGVGRAARAPRALPARKIGAASLQRWLYPALAAAAAVVLAIRFTPHPENPNSLPIGTNRIKGAGGITVQIGTAAKGTPRRIASPTGVEPLAPGERVRIGYRVGDHYQFVTVVSVDDQGEVSPLYPESGSSVELGRIKGDPDTTAYLPDSVEFTGKGIERLIVIFTDKAIRVDEVKKAAQRAFQQAKGDVAHLPALDVPGEQFQRTFVKP
jgi:hypothetical protein